MKRISGSLIILLLLFISFSLSAQPSKILSSSELKLALDKLNVLGSVLYIAAHPDDENTAVLSYFSTAKHLRTGYLSITRGDGGQNLIGNEQDELLGLIRTQELLAARKIDGAEQFFARSVDFGYSKSADETLEFWNHEEVLSDVVWIMRKFRPDIIITRFPSTGEGGHGHHTASAILAIEAFKAAGDPEKFSDQLKYVDVWQPKRLFWNAWVPALQSKGENLNSLISIDVGEYNPLLGKSYSEIAAESRTMHKSQGFGSSGRRGENLNYFLLLEGDTAQNDLLEGIDLSWSRVSGTEKISNLLAEADKNFNPENPEAILPVLIDAYKEMERHPENFWIEKKKEELLEVIRSASGLWIEAIADNYFYSPGSRIKINTGVVNRSDFQFNLTGISISHLQNDSVYNIPLSEGTFVSKDFTFKLPQDINITQPYWLENERNKFSYNVDDLEVIGQAENTPPLSAHFILSSPYGDLKFSTPVFYRWTDPVDGEKYRPVEIVPEVTIKLQDKIYLFPSNDPGEIYFSVRNNTDSFNGKIKLRLPDNWKAAPEEIPVSFDQLNEEKQFSFSITPPVDQNEAEFTIEVLTNGNIYNREMVTINYPHIQTQTIFPVASGRLVRFETEKIISSIGYIEGSGDDIPKYLTQLGYSIEKLSDIHLENNLLKYDAIITGIRAYNTRDRLEVLNKKLLDYVYEGGTLVVQYNTNRDLVTNDIGPYPFEIIRERVTDEESPVNFLKPNHKLLNFPNKITEKDFNGWVQERGLYFTGASDPKYETIISMHDKNEDALNGGLIFTNYGKGVFIYTSLSFFRQLPAGVSGAYRFFINLISSGNHRG